MMHPDASTWARHREALEVAAPDHVARLAWDRARIEAHQRDALRALLRHSLANSPFHARRLAGVNPDTFELEDLAGLPTMTKSDMMAHLDEVFTDRRLTRRLVERHVKRTGSEPSYLLDEYVVLASGGSSGERGLFVYGWSATVDYLLGLIRPAIARLLASGGPPSGGATMAMVAAGSAIHASRALAAIFGAGPFRITSVPVTLPLGEIVDRLNALQPMLLQGYPSVLSLLVEEKRAGRLRITPRSVTGSSEQFPAQTRAEIEAAFGVPVGDQFGSSEGLHGLSATGAEPLVLADDLAIVELVDDDNVPVPVGVPSAKVLITNLFNPTQPLIRYELTDRFVRMPDALEHGHLRVSVEGRQDDLLRYDDTVVHPNVVRSVLVASPHVIEYQVRQTTTGLDVSLVTRGRIDEGELAARLGHALEQAGVRGAAVRACVTDALERDLLTGKAKRFITLPAGPAGPHVAVADR